MSELKQKLSLAVLLVSNTAGNQAAQKATTLVQSFQAIASLSGKAAAVRFVEIIDKDCNPTALKPIRIPLSVISILEKWQAKLEQNPDASLSHEVYLDEDYPIRIKIEDPVDTSKLTGVSGLLVGTLTAVGIGLNWPKPEYDLRRTFELLP